MIVRPTASKSSHLSFRDGAGGGDDTGAGGGDDRELGMVKETLDGLTVGVVAELAGQLEDSGGAEGYGSCVRGPRH